MVIHGFLGWHDYLPPDSCLAPPNGTAMTVTCHGITQNGVFLHADFLASDGWSLEATLTDDAGNAAPATVTCDASGCR